MLGSLGVPELLFIMGLALLIFGPKRLPQVGRTLGQGLAEFRKASNDLRRTLNAEMIEQELRENDPRRIVRDSLQGVKDGLMDATDPKPGSAQGERAEGGGAKATDASSSGSSATVPTTPVETPAASASAPTVGGSAEGGVPGVVARGSAHAARAPEADDEKSEAATPETPEAPGERDRSSS